ncbi:uncharacterized protein LOC119110357 [Pollicipes pollicipes]|uniref:uncharacterized protein LOC119110357 n=1 Tax=Pollicipes pollicipes TaxID=41117 RepID=UPI001884CE75|nr:uncharacterized protein LOC119110357 [Pollicipes pollicipes]
MSTTTTRPTTTTVTTTTERDERYTASADYHWGSIHANADVYPGSAGFQLGDGPFGFQSSVRLPGAMCLVHRDFARADDACVKNPQNCSAGLSFSLWHKARYDVSLIGSTRYLPRQVLISTGGDVQGTPGVLVYVKNHVLGVIVSTGDKFWRVAVTALMVNNEWNNIGVRWQEPGDGDDQVVQGLQLFINQERKGAVIHGRPSPAKPPLEPVQLMAGCHKTGTYGLYSDFCSCEMDEVAFWTRALRDDELSRFVGGYKTSLSTSEFSSIVSQINLRDLGQQSEAIRILGHMLDGPHKLTAPGDPPAPGQQGEDEDEATEVGVDQLENLADIMGKMTDLSTVKSQQTPQELDAFANLVKVPSMLLRENNKAKWRELDKKKQKQKAGKQVKNAKEKKTKDAADMVREFESWALVSATRVASAGRERHHPGAQEDRQHRTDHTEDEDGLLQVQEGRLLSGGAEPKGQHH